MSRTDTAQSIYRLRLYLESSRSLVCEGEKKEEKNEISALFFRIFYLCNESSFYHRTEAR